MKSTVVDESLSTNATSSVPEKKLLYYFKRQQKEKPTSERCRTVHIMCHDNKETKMTAEDNEGIHY